MGMILLKYNHNNHNFLYFDICNKYNTFKDVSSSYNKITADETIAIVYTYRKKKIDN